ncbi:hypothetical protein NQZ68_009249 [Dissostichus eleginoides]|nr:hypothetical protein NQZ68_009249 [Dissostichus eleginoides]
MAVSPSTTRTLVVSTDCSVLSSVWPALQAGEILTQSLGCCRGDQRPQVTSDPRTLGALQEESFECGDGGRLLT